MKIEHDFHIHTHLSVCAKDSATVEHYLDAAKELGLKKLGFADHFWDETCGEPWNNFYRRQEYFNVERRKDELGAAELNGVEVFFGCECEYDPSRRGVAMTPAVAERFDFIIVPNSHTHMMMPKELYEPYEKHKQFMIDAYYDIINSDVGKYITAMAHPFEAVCCPYPNSILMEMMSDDEYKRIFDATAQKGIAVEVNTSGLSGMSCEEIVNSQPLRMFRLAKECGCKFSFGSDSHTDRGHDQYARICETVVTELALTEDDLASICRG